MLKPFVKRRCPACWSDEVSATVIDKGLPEVFTCWTCGVKYASEGVILWAPGKEARG